VPACGCDQGGRVGALSRGPAFGDATAETREAADTVEFHACRSLSEAARKAADVERSISSDNRSEAAGVGTDEPSRFNTRVHEPVTGHRDRVDSRFTNHDSRFV